MEEQLLAELKMAIQEVKSLAQNVKILGDTNQAAIDRMDQAYKMFTDRAEDLQLTSQDLKTAKENLEITTEALNRALGEVDAEVDDLAKIAAATTVIQQQLEAQAGS